MKNVLSNAVSKRWRLSKMKWSASMLNNNSNASIRSKLPKTLLRRLVTKFSRSLRQRNSHVVLKRSSKKISEMSFTIRKVSLLHVLVNKLHLKNVSEQSKSCKKQKISR